MKIIKTFESFLDSNGDLKDFDFSGVNEYMSDSEIINALNDKDITLAELPKIISDPERIGYITLIFNNGDVYPKEVKGLKKQYKAATNYEVWETDFFEDTECDMHFKCMDGVAIGYSEEEDAYYKCVYPKLNDLTKYMIIACRSGLYDIESSDYSDLSYSEILQWYGAVIEEQYID
jgi:hypothetical protein